MAAAEVACRGRPPKPEIDEVVVVVGGERAAAGRVRRGAGMRSWRCSLFNVPLRCCISDNPVALPLTVSRVFFARFYLESVYCLSTTQRRGQAP